jgi:hypothetical protein
MNTGDTIFKNTLNNITIIAYEGKTLQLLPMKVTHYNCCLWSYNIIIIAHEGIT